jgi:hypothetical protein
MTPDTECTCAGAGGAGRMQRRRRFRQMFADDRMVADLLVTEHELEVRQSDAARVAPLPVR